jgi:hypothetical protein
MMHPQVSEPARAVLRTLVNAHNQMPGGRFTVSRAISRRGTVRLSHPECNISVFPDVLNELIDNRFIEMRSQEHGYQVFDLTLRGFDFDAYMEQPSV